MLSSVKMEPKTVLVTGANRGLGLEFVKQFQKLDKPPIHVFAGCRDPDKAEVKNVTNLSHAFFTDTSSIP